MLQKILVPLDGSVLAEQALAYAVELSDPAHASLLLVRAAIAHTLAGVDGRERKAGAIAEAEEYLSRTRAALVERGFTCETVVPYGHAAESIVEAARVHHADLIVMSSHGRTGMNRLVFGSVAESVVANSPVPVLIARAWLPQLLNPDRSSIVVPLDGSVFAETALSPAVSLAAELGAGLVLVRAEALEVSTSEAEDYLATIRARLSSDAPAIGVATDVQTGDAATAIDMVLEQSGAAMVVMATHGRGGLLRSVTGSVAGRVVLNGRAPVVLVRPALDAALAPVPS